MTEDLTIEVRRATAADQSYIVTFQLEMAWETEEFRLDRPTVEAGVAAVFNDPSKGEYWVATQAGEVVGGLLTVPEWSDWRNGTVLWIHSLYVVPHARRHGVFRALYAQLKQMVSQDPSLKGLRLYVDKRNARAQQVYDSVGMNGEHYTLYEWMVDAAHGDV